MGWSALSGSWLFNIITGLGWKGPLRLPRQLQMRDAALPANGVPALGRISLQHKWEFPAVQACLRAASLLHSQSQQRLG